MTKIGRGSFFLKWRSETGQKKRAEMLGRNSSGWVAGAVWRYNGHDGSDDGNLRLPVSLPGQNRQCQAYSADT